MPITTKQKGTMNKLYQSFLNKTGLNTVTIVVVALLTWPAIMVGNYAAETLLSQIETSIETSIVK
jgi:hypothetical protein